jgi:hypothetical protein
MSEAYEALKQEVTRRAQLEIISVNGNGYQADEPDPGELPVRGIQAWQLFTLADAYQERPPLTYVVDGLFSLPSLNILYSGPGMLKSLLLADLFTCTAAGLPWLEPLPGQTVKPFQTVSMPVLWVDFDNGKRRTHERFEAFGRARSLPVDTPLFYTSMPSPWLDASDNTAVEELINLINQNGGKLVALDNLGLITGGVDENSPAMIPVMSNLRRVAEGTGAAIVVIHHQRKGSGMKSRAGETLRGHSCIEAALDLALLIERKEDSDRVSVKSTKTRDVDVLPFAAEWTYEHKPGTTELAQARFFRVALEKDEKQEALQVTIIACVKMNPGQSQNKLKETVKAQLPEASLHSIRNEILKMTESGQIKAVGSGDGKASAYYQNEDITEY